MPSFPSIILDDPDWLERERCKERERCTDIGWETNWLKEIGQGQTRPSSAPEIIGKHPGFRRQA